MSLCRRFIRRCKQGCLQFVILKPILVTVTFILYAKGRYKDGNFSANQAYLYITIIYTFSYSLALYALALFYVACKDLLKPFNPVPKFIIIKSVVFLTYWQVRFRFFCASCYVLMCFPPSACTHTERGPPKPAAILARLQRNFLSFLSYRIRDLEMTKFCSSILFNSFHLLFSLVTNSVLVHEEQNRGMLMCLFRSNSKKQLFLVAL